MGKMHENKQERESRMEKTSCYFSSDKSEGIFFVQLIVMFP